MVVLIARVAFVTLLVGAVVCDLRSRRIPNEVTATLAVLGVVASAAGAVDGHGIAGALGSLVLGLVLWLPFYALGMMGAGDVKLFAAAAAWLTAGAVLYAALATALVGGGLSLLWMLRERGLGFTAVRLAHALRQPTVLRDGTAVPERGRARLPYGVAMAIGLLGIAIRSWSFA